MFVVQVMTFYYFRPYFPDFLYWFEQDKGWSRKTLIIKRGRINMQTKVVGHVILSCFPLLRSSFDGNHTVAPPCGCSSHTKTMAAIVTGVGETIVAPSLRQGRPLLFVVHIYTVWWFCRYLWKCPGVHVNIAIHILTSSQCCCSVRNCWRYWLKISMFHNSVMSPAPDVI